MKLIVFNPITSTCSKMGYATSIRIAYLLNGYAVTAGINEATYMTPEGAKQFTFEMRIKYLISCHKNRVEHASFVEAEKSLKVFNSTKNKSSQYIVMVTKLKNKINQLFEAYFDDQYNALDRMFALKPMRELINPNRFYFYHLTEADAILDDQTITPVLDLMQLILPDPERENPIFFININEEAGDLLEFKINPPNSQEAEDPEYFYWQNSFVFPRITSLSANEITGARIQMEEQTAEFCEKLDQWASICYKDPQSNAGLEFFRENLNDLLPSLKDKALQTQILKTASELSSKKSQSEIIIGQAPIDLIWQIYRDTKCISEEQYDQLTIIREEQSPKFDGRWPVIFYTQILDDLNAFVAPTDTFESINLPKS